MAASLSSRIRRAATRKPLALARELQRPASALEQALPDDFRGGGEPAGFGDGHKGPQKRIAP
jgi:hypothetical protein